MVRKPRGAGYRRRFGKKNLQKQISKQMIRGIKAYPFTRTVLAVNIISSSSAITNGSIAFNLSNLPNYTEFSNLYDQYMIAAVRLMFIPRFTEVPATNSGAQTNSGTFTYVIDYDDANPPANDLELFQYPMVKVMRPTRTWKMYFKPKFQAALIKTGTTVSTGKPSRGFIDIAVPDVPHYGVKYNWSVTSAVYGIDVYVKYYLMFKQPR